jgi:hypothetical protein
MNVFAVAGSNVSKNIALLTLVAVVISILPASAWAEDVSTEPQVIEEVIQVTPEEVQVAPVENEVTQTEVVVIEEEVEEQTQAAPAESLSEVTEFLAVAEPEVINTCLIPDNLGDESAFVLQTSGEKSIDQMLVDHGYSAIDTTTDQMNYQVWNLTDTSADSVTFSMRVLGKRAGNTQIVGYYKAGDVVSFTPVLTQALDTDGESSVSVTIPAAFANSFGFAIQSADKTWFSEIALNSDGEDHIAAFNPSANTYLLAFEDFNNLSDGDYNDIVIEISRVSCQKDNGDNGDGGEEVIVNRGGNGGGTRLNRAPRGEVLGASTSTPQGIVLGEATSTLPVGAPNTGAGGTAPLTIVLPAMVAILSTKNRKNK